MNGSAHLRSVLLQPLLLPDDVLEVLDGLGDAGVDVDQVVGADGELVPQHPLVERQAEWQIQLQEDRQTDISSRSILGFKRSRRG